MEDVDKLDNIQDGFIHYLLIRFCHATRLQILSTNKTGPGSTCACTSLTKRAASESPTTPAAGTLRRDDQRQGCRLPRHLCLPCSTGLAAGKRPSRSLHLGCPRTTARANSFIRNTTGSGGVRRALHCHWNAIATKKLGHVPFTPRGILSELEAQSRTRGGQSGGVEDQPQ